MILEWRDAAGNDLREAAFTRVIGPYGCLVVSLQNLDRHQRLNVINSSTDSSNEATVVWNGKHAEDGWELGIELERPPMDFWGLEL